MTSAPTSAPASAPVSGGAPGPRPATALVSTPLTTAAGTSWTLRALEGPVPPELSELHEGLAATVPGEVHTDLLAAGAVPDPFDADNEAVLAWIGATSWRLSAAFTPAAGALAACEVHELVLDGVDTFATITLNGTELGRTRNMHRSHRFDVTAVLVDGENRLVVDLEAPRDAAERADVETGRRPHVNPHPFNAVRKMASSYGWDWGPDLTGVGIWKELRLESWSGVRLAGVRPLAGVEGTTGVLDAHVDLVLAPSAAAPSASTADSADGAGSADTAGAAAGGQGLVVRVEVTAPAGRVHGAEVAVAPGQTSAAVRVAVEDAALWWPRGYGEQPLHDVVVTLADAPAVGAPSQAAPFEGPPSDGPPFEGPLATWAGRVGFRTVTLDVAPDEHGSPFLLSVNGELVHVRGANWIPDDALMTRLTPQTYAQGVRDATEAGMNLLRVWGGGIYESVDFYRACDEAGVLVWQDFLFACAAYSEEEPLRSEVEAEAREHVARLSQHASLALWNGCNENIWGYVDWSWRVPLAGRTWGEGYYTELLPAVVAELDPRTPYSPGSPFSYSSYLHPNDDAHGTSHLWDVWNQVDYTAYADHPSRFASEFGFQGPPAWSTLTGVVHDEPLDPYGPQMLVHQKAEDGNLKLERGLGDHLPRWRDIDEWHWATQLNQARAVAFGVEHWRSLHPVNSGTVVWQLNDCWPVVSWAAVDGAGIRKPLWFALRRVYADVLLTVQPRDGVPTLVVHNDSPRAFTAQLVVTRSSVAAGGEVLAREVLAVDVPARSAATSALPPPVLAVGDPAAEVVRVDAGVDGVAPAFWYPVEDPLLQLVPTAAAVAVRVEPTADGALVEVTASALVKDLSLFPDRLDAAARVDSGMVTLVAGESHTFRVTGAPLDDAAMTALTTAPVLRAANDLVTGG